MTESSSGQSAIYTAPRTDVSQDQGKFRIHLNFPGQAVPSHDDRQGNELITDPEHLTVMGAGSGFWHAEETLADDPPFRML
jgi:hypothetical protein